jgi:hypothetical protein
MTSAADIAAPEGTIQRAHEHSFLLLSIISLANADVPSVVAQAVLCRASSGASLRDLAVLFSILR